MTKLILLVNLLCLFLCTDSSKVTDTNLVQENALSTASTVIKKGVKYDTKPILILSFEQLIELTVNYLQNLEGMLKAIAANSHEKDAISNSIKDEIIYLFTGNEVNSYELNEHIKTVLGESMDDIFEGQATVSLSYFCDELAHATKSKLITPFQTTSLKELKKDFGENFGKYKNSPYPSVRQILTAISLNDIPFDVQGKAAQERQLKNLIFWCDDFQRHLSNFEIAYKTDFLNNASLQKRLKGFGSSFTDELTPPSCKLHLIDNIVNGLGSNAALEVGNLVSIIKTELDALRVTIKTSIEAENFEGSDEVASFLGIQAEDYFDCIQTALEKNRFKEYKEVIKDWVIAVDTSINNLVFDEEDEKHQYQSKLIALNLSKLFRVDHPLIDFSDFITPIIKELKARDTSMKLSEIDELFSIQTRKAPTSIYAKLIDLYNTEMEKGSFEFNFDRLVTTLPNMGQIKAAILSTKE